MRQSYRVPLSSGTVLGFMPLLVLTTLLMVVRGQRGQRLTCDSAKAGAMKVAINDCGCTKPPVCTTKCDSFNIIASCTSGCAYCDAATMTICGVMVNTYRMSGGSSGVYVIEETWRYTRGRQGTITYGESNEVGNCWVIVNGTACNFCWFTSCTGVPPPQYKYRNDINVNCTKLGVGATATACPFHTYFAGPLPLDESALDVKNGILAPMAYPHVLCQRGLVVLDPNYTAPLPPPSPPPTTTPKASPTRSPNTITTSEENCGLFGLNIVCFRGCGLIRRWLGLCS